ncbi:MAG: MASE3 domain-containing protein [Spirochaeta sp.]
MRNAPAYLIRLTVILFTVTLVSILLYFLSRSSYLLFHSIVEFYSIIIAAGIYIVAWNTRRHSMQQGLVFLGIGYLFIAVLDFFHTLGYQGMGIFTDYDFYANQLWVAARSIESISILAYVHINWKRVQLHPVALYAGFGLITSASLAAIFVWKIFPPAFIPGVGQTPFKLVSEYIIIAILLFALLRLYRTRNHYDSLLFRYLSISIALTVCSELAFTLYTDNYGVLNVVGHIFKIFSFYLIYRSVVVNVLQRPYQILFNELVESEQNLKSANKAKSTFFNIIAHDLKSPFFGIVNTAHVLRDLTSEAENPEIQQYGDLVSSAADTTYQLLENLLEWASSQTDRIEFKPERLNLAELIDEIVTLQEPAARDKEIALIDETADDLPVFADANMMQTILRNLISNAVKFTRPGGTVRITARQLPGEWEVTVTDSGIGMPPGRIAQVFSIESKTAGRGTAGEKGTGLGLVLCKEFVERNRGRIWIDSIPDRGTSVTFTLPN